MSSAVRPAVERPDRATAAGGQGRWRRASPGFWAACCVFAALAWALAWRAGRLYVSSDSVAQQSILQTWLHVGHVTTYLPPDTWLLKFPFYLAIEPLPLSADTRLLVEALALGGVGVVLSALSSRWLADRPEYRRRWTDAVLPLAWLALLGGGLGQYLSIMPNSRNLELGLSFLGLALAARYLDGSPDPRWRRWGWRSWGTGVVTVLLLGLLWVDDPYFAYLVAVPLAAACLAWFVLRVRDRRLLAVAGVLVGSLAAIPVLRRVLAAAGLVVVPDATGITGSPRVLLAHLPILGPALASQVGLQDAGRTAWLAHALTVLVLVAGLLLSGYLVVVGWRTRRLVLAFLGGHWVVVALGVVANRTIYDFHAGRYLVLGVYDLAVTIGVGLAVLRPRRPRLAAGLTGLLVVAVVANAVTVAVDRPRAPALMAQQSAILRTLQDRGLTKGYTEFWASNLFTQRSAGAVQVAEVVCSDGQLWSRYWLTDSARHAAAAPRTFLLWDPTAGGLTGCSAAGIEAQLGAPAERLPTSGGAVILIYDRDIAALIREPEHPAG